MNNLITARGETDDGVYPIVVNNLKTSPNSTRIALTTYRQYEGYGIGNFQLKIYDAITEQQIFSRNFDHTPVFDLAWSSSNDQVFSVTDAGTIQSWDITTGQQSTYQDPDSVLLSVAVSPDNRTLSAVGWNNAIYFWDLSTRQLVNTIDLGLPVNLGSENALSWVGWSPDGSKLATTGWDRNVRIWDAQPLTPIHVFSAHTDDLSSGSWSPDSTLLATGGFDNSVIVWNILLGQAQFTLQGHTNAVKAIAWNPSGNYLASGSDDGTVRIWDMRSGTQVHVLTNPNGVVRALDWGRDGRLVFGGQTPGNVSSLSELITISTAVPTATPTTFVQSITSFTLINADTNQPVPGFDPIPDGATINIAAIGTANLSVRANPSPAAVGSVRFGLNGNTSFRTETAAPYALNGHTSGSYTPWPYTLNTLYTLTGTPFTGANAEGTAGTALTITFTLVHQSPATVTPTPSPTATATPTFTPTPTVQANVNLVTNGDFQVDAVY